MRNHRFGGGRRLLARFRSVAGRTDSRKKEGWKMNIGKPQRVIEVVPLVEPAPPAPEPMPDDHPSVAEPKPHKEPAAP